MASQQKKKRITFKPARPNPLFQSWLQELYDEAKEKKSRLEPMLKEALESISKYPLPLSSGAECAILKGFDKKLCLFMDKRLEVYNENSRNSIPSLHSSTEGETLQITSDEENTPPVATTSSSQQKIKVPKKNKTYKPTHKSGGYAILIALLENMQANSEKPSLTKEDIIDKAQHHSEESFTRPKPNTYYTAWSNMARLITKGYVQKTRGKKDEFSLTDTGIAMALELQDDSQHIPTVNDVIFNENSFGKNSRDNSQEAAPEIASTNDTNEVEIDKENCFYEDTISINCGEFDVFLLIDKMEVSGKNDPTVAQFKKFPDLKHEFRSLKVGDFTWVARSKTDPNQEFILPFIVERKRMDDLGSSIKDGRFHEQKFRLRKCGLKNVIYLVENYGKNQHVGLPLPSLMQALANTRIQDGFRVHITDSLTNSARFLAMMTKRLTLEYKDKNLKGRNGECKSGELMTFTYFNKSSMKTKTLTVTETFIKIILQLKGMSVEKALAITNVYKTPRSLIVKYQKISRKEGEMLLTNLKYSDACRQVGPTVSKAIYQLFSSNTLK